MYKIYRNNEQLITRNNTDMYIRVKTIIIISYRAHVIALDQPRHYIKKKKKPLTRERV